MLAGCGALEAPETALNCSDCIPPCAVGGDPEDFEGSALRLGCEAELVTRIRPSANEMMWETEPEIRIELARPHAWADAPSGGDCDGPIQLLRVGRVGEVPGAVAADIVTRASITSLPLWPPERDCVEGRWQVEEAALSFEPAAPLEALVWYEVVVPGELPFDGPGLCSELSWRFTIGGCGNGVVEHAEAFLDWICLGHVEAEIGYFQPYEEECDDGNLEYGDACSGRCLKETGWTCDDEGCRTRCGDGVRAGDEACDDANNEDGDGCSADCSRGTEADTTAGPARPQP